MFNRRSAMMTGSIAAIAAAACAAVASPPPARHRVELEVSDYPLVFVEIRVNQWPVRALVDTGSVSALRLSTRLVRQLGLELQMDPTRQIRGLDNRPQPLHRTHVDRLTLGDWTGTGVTADVVAGRIESVASQVGTAFDAILGWAFLSRWNIAMDYRQRLLDFGGTPLTPAEGAVIMPFADIGGLPVVTGRIREQAVQLLLDTGAPTCNVDTRLVPDLRAGALVEHELQLADHRFSVHWRVKDLSALHSALGSLGVIGNNLLGRQRFQLDISRRTLTLG